MPPHPVKLFMYRLQMAVKPEYVSLVTATYQARVRCSRLFTAVFWNILDVLYEHNSHNKMINIRAPTHSHSKHMGVAQERSTCKAKDSYAGHPRFNKGVRNP